MIHYFHPVLSLDDVLVSWQGYVNMRSLLDLLIHLGNAWLFVLQLLIYVACDVLGYPHFSILCGWQGLRVAQLIGTPYFVLSAHLSVYLQRHLVGVLAISGQASCVQ